MATTTSRVLRMSFGTSLGGTATISLPEPKADLTAAQIEAVMDQIIAKNIFQGSTGEYTSKKDVRIIDTTTNDLYDPPLV